MAEEQQRIDRLNASIRETINQIRQLRASLEDTSRIYGQQVSDAEELIQQHQRLNRILAERARLRASRGGGGTASDIPGGFQPGDEPHRPKVGDNIDFTGLGEKAKRAGQGIDAQTKATERAERAAAKAAAEEKRLAEARNRVANDPVYRNALRQAEQRGFSLENLRSIEDRGGNVQRLRFSQTTGGVNQQFNPYVNLRTGSSTPGLSSQFRSFGSDLVRDIGQFTKWSIAVAAVYTPLQKLNELITVMIDNESRLADATIAANVPFERAGEIFDTAAEAATRAGESISGVIDAYAQSIRAAGRYGSEAEKTQKATALLNDSLILSKLSALDQATAIDTLSAALLQSDRELDQGQELLNKWVRVSQIANVTIDGLATGVAVLGDAAETSGLSIDQLNGLIAVLSEQSISGSKEAANTAKALIGSYQSDKAEATLNRFGIALRNTNGEVRGFLEIYEELASLRSQGILTESAVSEISLALGGGGVRRAKDASALINSTDRLNEVSRESALITGEQTLAEDALAKKLQTVESANTRLGNSFQELAQTLGDDGGLLDVFKGMVDLLTLITTGADNLFTALGRSGPVIATIATSLLAIRSVSSGTKDVLLSRLAGAGGGQFFGGGQFIPGGGRAPAGGTTIGGNRGVQFGAGILSDILRLNLRGGAALGGLGVGASAVSNLQAGREENAAANALGGIIGGAIGGILSGGIGIAAGAAIGSSVADSFVTGVLTHSKELDDYFAGILPTGGTRGVSDVTGLGGELPLEDLVNQMYTLIGDGNEFIGGLRAQQEFAGSRRALGVGSINQERFATEEAAALALLGERQDEESRRLFAQLQARFDQQLAAQGTLPQDASSAQVRANQVQIQELQRLAEAERARQLELVSTGELRPSEFGQISERLAGFPTAAKQEVDAFGNAFIDVSKDIDNVSEAYNAFLELTVSGTSEQQAQINQYVADIQKLQANYDNWEPSQKDLVLNLTTGDRTFQTRDALGEFLGETQRQAAQFTNASLVNSRLQNLRLPPIVGGTSDTTAMSDLNRIIEEGTRIQEQYFRDMDLSAEEIDAQVASIEAFAVYTENAGKTFFETVEGLNQWAYDAGRKLLEEMGELSEKQGFGFQQFDVDRGTLERLAQQSIGIGQQWAEQFPGFESKPEDLLAITSEGLAKPIHADFRILALLLEKIVDQNQKQLDGQYNIPEGATFWVPLTAAYYRNQGAGGGDLQSMLDSLAVDQNTSATQDNTSALRAAADAFKGDLGYSRQAEYLKDRALQFRGDTGESRASQYSKMITEEGNRIASLGFRGDPGFSREPKQQLPGGTPTFNNTGMAQLLSELRNLVQGIFSQRQPAYGGSYDPTIPRGSLGARDVTGVNATPTAKLDLRVSSNVNLMVDGRVLATTLQNYLASELLRTEQSQGTITRRFII